jgi:YcaO-like protein with predicted kinase domain
MDVTGRQDAPAGPDNGSTSGSAALLRSLSCQLGRLGITRVAIQTGLDRIGIPCCAAIRPNSTTLAVHQGKGIDMVSAEISAIMEAAEYVFAEAPEPAPLRLSATETVREGFRPVDFRHLMPHGWQSDDRPLLWLSGTWLGAGTPALVPLDAVQIGTPPRDLPGISQSTNGLAAGPTPEHALLHALLELIERDAVCLWGFRRDAAALTTAFDPGTLVDPAVNGLVTQLSDRGFRLNLFDITTDIGVPAVYAVLVEAGGADRHFDAATGAGCHPVAAIAARRAIVEAAQTRISVIAGARDDIVAGDYETELNREIAVLAAPISAHRAGPTGLPDWSSTATQLADVRNGLGRAGLADVASFPLGGERLGIHVLRAFVPGLEDRLSNRNWRPGPRAARAMLGL